MAENPENNGNHAVALNVRDKEPNVNCSPSLLFSVSFIQKIIAEVLATYFLIFAGCSSIVVNLSEDKVVSVPGISIVWGLAVMVMVYSVGHISGAHLNPAITIAFASTERFPWKQVPPYIFAQIVGATLASGTIRLLFDERKSDFARTLPSGAHVQSFVIEFIITFALMFVISGVATDNRAIGELAGLAIGATVVVNAMFCRVFIIRPIHNEPISGASMNPARSLGPAMVSNNYKGLWIYIVGPTLGALCGAWVYNLIRFTDKPLREITKTGSFLEGSGKT